MTNQNKISRLLSRESSNTKLKKNKIPTWNLSLAQANLSGYEVCPHRSDGCTKACVGYAGMAGIFPHIMKSRIAKTKFFFEDRKAFLALLEKELQRADNYCSARSITGRVRLNTFSDVVWEKMLDLKQFKNLAFYDYTKNLKSAVESLNYTNYRKVYSFNENSDIKSTLDYVYKGGTVAVVFGDVEYTPSAKKIGALPATWNGIKVVDGDATDDRYLDPKGCIVGLRLKGTNKRRNEARSEKFAVVSVKGKEIC